VLPQLVRDPAALCVRAQAAYGYVARLPVLWGSVYLLTHPDHIEHVLVRRNRNHWKGRLFNRADFLFGNGLVLADGEDWQRQRRLMQPAFGHDRVARLVPTLTDVVDRRANAWQARVDGNGDATVDMDVEMMSLTLDLICHAMFSLSMTDAELDDIARAFGTVLNHLGLRFATFMFPDSVRLPGERKARRALAYLDGVVNRIIDERLGAAPRDDLLSMLLDARDEEGAAMSRQELRDQLITILFGGYEATAHSLSWTWYLIDRHPDVEEKLRKEWADASSPDDLRYTRQVIDESLRLYPSFWEVLRSSYDADEIGGYEIPANASVLLSPYVTHRLAEFWPEPTTFDPSRWDPAAAPPHKYAYFPFASGQRQCIGRHLALLEMQLVLWRLGQRFRPQRPPGAAPVAQRAQSTLRSKDGMAMRIMAA
jgi:cytochrome P450